MIPCLNMSFLIGHLGYQSIGYSKIHDDPTPKPSLAFFLPMSFFGLFYVALAALGAGFLNDFCL